MQYTEGNLGRVFALRLEHGDPMPQTLEDFVQVHGINSGLAFMVGGADDGSRLVVGPEDSNALPANPMVTALTGAHEIAAVGMIFPDAEGKPTLHMHAACGRERSTITGCIRAGIVTWHVLELVIIEITGLTAARLPDAKTGFNLLQCNV
ncbi:MAG: PPC domain-containing DNA-binding protein [Armatimonadia bacterium]